MEASSGRFGLTAVMYVWYKADTILRLVRMVREFCFELDRFFL